MSTKPVIDANLREKILAEPDVILDDQDLMRALVAANERAMGSNIVDLRGVAMERLETRSAALILQAREDKGRDALEEQVILEMVDLMLDQGEERPASVRRLERNTGLLLPGDTLAEDLKTRGGSLLLSRGQVLSGKLIRQLKDFAKQREITGPITIARESE